MSQNRINPLFRLFPSLTDLAFIMPIVFLFGWLEGATTLLFDGDTGWHIRTGEWILANGRVPERDLFSFTKPGETWYAWEWLWDVVFGWLHLHAGMAAVALASMVLISLLFALVFRLANRMCGNALVAIALTLLAITGSSIHWLARPHLVTLLFSAIFFTILERVEETGASPSRRNVLLLAALPVLTVLWTNLHGGFFVGLILIAGYGAGRLAGALLDPSEDRRAALSAAGRYGLTAAASVAATFVNPYFYRLHVHIAHYLADPQLFRINDEFRPLSFSHPGAPYFEGALLVGAAAVFWHLSRRRFTQAFLLGVWLHLALTSGRNFPILMVVAPPIVAVAVVEWLAALRNSGAAGWLRRAVAKFEAIAAEVGETDAIGRCHVVSVAAVLLVGSLFYAPSAPAAFRVAFDARRFPVRAAETLRGTEAQSRVFTRDQWGDYLIYAFYPQMRVFVDGRSDFYGFAFLNSNLLDPLSVKYNWEQTLNRLGVNTVLLPADAPLVGALKESRRWRVTYDDGHAILFRAISWPAYPGEQVSAVAHSGLERDREIAKPKPTEPCGRMTTEVKHTLGVTQNDDFHAQFLGGRAGAGPDRVQPFDGFRGAGLGGAVHQRGQEHQHHLEQEQHEPGKRS